MDPEPVVAELRGPEIDAALSGTGDTRWRALGENDAQVVSAAYPVWHEGRVSAAVVVEETGAAIQTVRRQALADLFTKTLVAFTAGGATLLLVATRISARLRRLRDDTDRAIDEHGRVVGSIRASASRDEIGDLGRSFSAMMERLRQYNHYLEQLAQRLSHELRTPLGVVRSSLDNLELAAGEDSRALYVSRAREGIRRLDSILTRMSEAARLEQSLGQSERVPVDVARLFGAAVDAYRDAWPGRCFELQAKPDASLAVLAAPDLLLQMLDKLVSNALDFGEPAAPIRIALRRLDGDVVLEVENLGPTLPEAMGGEIFESMVSVRATKTHEPHLGLGLYIVRTIAQHHGGRVRAENLAGGDGARFVVTLPALPFGLG